MDVDEWWERLDAPTREWLFAHNGEALPAEVVSAIDSAGGVVSAKAGRVDGASPSGFRLSDEVVDWI